MSDQFRMFRFYTERKAFQKLTDIPPNGIEITQHHVGNCYNNNICFRQGQRWACDENICSTLPANQTLGVASNNIAVSCESRCIPLANHFIDETCWSRSIIAQKVIRLCGAHLVH